MCDEWLDFIAECRVGKIHEYDIVEGPMADDTIWNFVNDYLCKTLYLIFDYPYKYYTFKHFEV